MKKFFFLVFIVLISFNGFGVDFSFSAGGGGLLGYTFTRYTLEGGSIESIQNMDRFNYAGFIFFDATYAELSILIQGGNGTYMENMIFDESTSSTDSTGNGYETSLGFSLTGKYPFDISDKFVLFPMLGVEYQIALTQKRQPEGNIVYDRTKGHLAEDRDKNDESYPIHAWNSFWINIGAGTDYFITGSLFLRGEFLFGFRLPTTYENGALEVVKNPPMNARNPKLAGLTGGPNFKIGVGYCF